MTEKKEGISTGWAVIIILVVFGFVGFYMYRGISEYEGTNNRITQTTLSKEEYKALCKTYTFEELARNPESFKGNKVTVTGKVIQVVKDQNNYDLRVNITKTDLYGTDYYDDTIYVTYTKKSGENNILEDDIITIYGESKGEYSYTSALGVPITVPHIEAQFIDFN